MRRLDEWAIAIGIVLLVQLTIGTIAVTVAYAQRVPLAAGATRANNEEVAVLSSQMKTLQDLRIGERLAVLDDMKNRVEKIELLAYGLIFTMAGNIVLAVVSLVGQKQRRKATA